MDGLVRWMDDGWIDGDGWMIAEVIDAWMITLIGRTARGWMDC